MENQGKYWRFIITACLFILCMGVGKPHSEEASAWAKPLDIEKLFSDPVFQNWHKGSVNAIAFNPDDTVIASAGGDGLIKITETASGRLIRTISHGTLTLCLSFNPEGNILASGGEDRFVRMWNPETGKFVRAIGGKFATVNRLIFTPDGNYIFTSGSDFDESGATMPPSVKLWEIKTGRMIRSFQENIANQQSIPIALSLDGKLLAAIIDDTVLILDVINGRAVKTIKTSLKNANLIAFRPNSNELAVGRDTIKFFSLDSGMLLRTLHCDTTSAEMFFSHDGKFLIIAGGRLSWVQIYDADTCEIFRNLSGSARGKAMALGFTGRLLAYSESDGNLVLWDLANRKTLWRHSGSWNIPMKFKTVVFSPDSRYLALAESNDDIHLWDLDAGRQLRTVSARGAGQQVFTFTPDGKSIVYPNEYNEIVFRDILNNHISKTFDRLPYQISSILFSPDGNYIASSSNDGTITLWESKTGNRILDMEFGGSGAEYIAFSPDGKHLASSDYTQIKIWDLVSGKCIQTIKSEESRFKTVVFMPDGNYVATLVNYQEIKLFSVMTGRYIWSMGLVETGLSFLSLGPDNRQLISGSPDGSMKFWSIDSSRPLKSLFVSSSGVSMISFARDKKLMAVLESDGKIRLWALNDFEPLGTFMYRDRDWLFYSPDGLFDYTGMAIEGMGRTQGMRNIQLSSFSEEYYQPNIFALAVKRESVPGKKDIRNGFAVPPEVSISSLSSGGSTDQESVEIEVKVIDTGGGVQKVRLFHNGKLTATTQDKVVEDICFPLTYKFTVNLNPGDNAISATAFSRDNIEASHASISITRKDKLSRVNLHFIGVGIGKSGTPVKKLELIAGDVEKLAETFMKQKGKLYNRVITRVLLDNRATRLSILDPPADLPGADDVLVIYLSGYRSTVGGKYYFLPFDYASADPFSIKKTGLSQQDLTDWIKRLNSQKTILVLDTSEIGTDPGLISCGCEQKAAMIISKHTGANVLAAASPHSNLDADGPRSLVNYLLLTGLDGEADSNGDRYVSSWELMKYTRNGIVELASESGKKQFPSAFISGNDYIIAAY